jgi:hypothetical protein
MPVAEAEVDELFSTPPTQFIAARNELVKRARAGKQEELAKEIASLRKPTATVWLLNQIARHHERETAALLQAGEKLRRAQTAALRGVGPEPLREANDAWRAAVSSALKRAREILKTAGGRQDLEEPRLVATLLGAAADTKSAELLKRGKLTEELKPPGFEAALGVLGAGPAKPRTAARRPKADEASSRKVRVAEEKRRREAVTALRSREREAAKAEKAASRAEREAAALDARASQTLERATRAREIAVAARKRATDSRAAVEDLRRRASE